MARPTKQGLDYFPLDCDFLSDEKVIPVTVNYGAKGVAVLISLLCAIYRQSYFVQWSDTQAMKVARELPGVNPELANKVVSDLVKYGFFNKEIFEEYGVLTSAGIQRRYLQSKKGRPDVSQMQFWLVLEAKTPILDAKTPIKESKMPQSKVKESKVKKKGTKLRGSFEKSDPPDGDRQAPSPNVFVDVSLSDVQAVALMPGIAELYPSQIDIEKFHAYYSARGWMIAPGIPMASLRDAFIAWLNKRSAYESDRDNAQRERQRREKVEQAQADIQAAEQEPKHYMSGDELAEFLRSRGHS